METIITNQAFAKDVLNGLSLPQKRLSSKYFYDDIGSRIFKEIMNMPEYYLTDSEFEIFNFQSKEIVKALNFKGHFNVIELGAGDGSKTARLLDCLVSEKYDFTYIPIDISQEANNMLKEKLSIQFPNLDIQPRTGDYLKILKNKTLLKDPSLLMFIGGNIGNYEPEDAINLFKLFGEKMKPADKLLVGIDLKKNPLIIHQAYFDPHGITKRFNINLLARINRELGANFQLDYFDFYCYYNPISGDLRSYLVSLKEQNVFIEELNKTFHFEWGELIWTELSKKYDFKEIKELGDASGFGLVNHFKDCKHFFTDALFEKL